MLIDGRPLLAIKYAWRERDGSLQSVEFSGGFVGTGEELEARARRHGWPGHSGRFQDYLRDDLRRLWARFGSAHRGL